MWTGLGQGISLYYVRLGGWGSESKRLERVAGADFRLEMGLRMEERRCGRRCCCTVLTCIRR